MTEPYVRKASKFRLWLENREGLEILLAFVLIFWMGLITAVFLSRVGEVIGHVHQRAEDSREEHLDNER